MELKEKKINIKSKLCQEVYLIRWTIENFSMIPFKDNNPIRSPFCMLGEHVDTTWSLFLSKEVHEGVENVGFKLVRTEDGAVWNNVTVSLSVVVEDGRLVNCTDKEVLGGGSQNRFTFLIRPSKSKHALKNGMDTSTQFENSRGLEGSVTKSKTVTFGENFCDHDCIVVDKEFCSSEEAKKRNEQEYMVCGSLKVENGRSLNQTPKSESCRMEDSRVKSEVQQDGAELTPEELLKLKDLTVVCIMEYTYMKCNILEDAPMESVGSELKEVFKHLHDTGNFSDITLKCKNVYFPCHKAVLAPLSTAFDKLLKGNPNPGTVNLHMPLHIARAMIMYMYIRELPNCLSADDCRQLCHIADHFGVEGMKKSCLDMVRCLESEESCSEEEEEGEVRSDKQPKLLYSVDS